RRKHAVGQHVLFGHFEVGFGLCVRDVGVLRVRDRAARIELMPATDVLVGESVHPAVRAGKTSPTVAVGKKGTRAVVEIPARFETDRLQRDLLAAIVTSEARGVRSGIAIEKIIEAAVLLDDDDDVLNLAGTRRGRFWRRGPAGAFARASA